MIIGMDDNIASEKVGNKVKSLMEMRRSGFNVPNGFVLDSDTFDEIVSYNKREKSISQLISGISEKNSIETGNALEKIFDQFEFPPETINHIRTKMTQNKKYSVRSSGLMEDLEKCSFAGQYDTFLNISGTENIARAIIKCYQSMYSATVLNYLANNNLSADNLKMAVLVQEMVHSEKSGVAFSVNPLTGDDKEIVVEIAEGLGENVVSGKVEPERYYFNWYENQNNYDEKNKLLSKYELSSLTDTVLNIQMYFGYPCDIEFAFEKGQLYILQARRITKIKYCKINDQWSNANFRDGVSACVCTPYMWSLYEYIWDNTLKKYIIDSNILREKEIRKLSNMFFGRPYWNMSIVKKGMSAVPGYKEKEFDSEFGVKITYNGDGEKTRITPKSVCKILRIGIRQKNILSKQIHCTQAYKDELLDKYDKYLQDNIQRYSFEDFQVLWHHLIKDNYYQSEGTYFWQIYLNTVYGALFKKKMLHYVGSSGYFDLIGGLDNISHLMPFYDMWEIGRKITGSEKAFAYWKSSSAEAIEEDYKNNSESDFMPDFIKLINRYGYHSEKELDVSYPCYFEDPGSMIKMLKENILLDESHNPELIRKKQKLAYEEQLEKIRIKVSTEKYKNLIKSIEKMRSLLWWREELRDVSSMFLYIVRKYTMELAKRYTEKGIIETPEDIWFLKMEDIFEFINCRKNSNELKSIVKKNKDYFQSFRNYTSENEIGSAFGEKPAEAKNVSKNIKGIGCNSGIVKGTARVIEGVAEIWKLQADDILITKFTDTGWTSKFAALKGIVSEYGGILCHLAIVSREYGIPCVVCANNATKQIKDGSTISVNGETGEIIIL